MSITVNLAASDGRTAHLNLTARDALRGDDSIANLLVRLDEGIHTSDAAFVIDADSGESSVPIADITGVTIEWTR